MDWGKFRSFKLIDGLLVLGILLVIVGIGMNFKDNFFEKADVKLTTKEVIPTLRQAQGEQIGVQGNNKVTIDIGGEVIKSGVYKLDFGSRVNDVLIAAGGLAINADREWVDKNLNKAEILVDGQKIYIPNQEESKKLKVESDGVLGISRTETKIVRINTATLEDLDTLNGIGPSIAQRIIDYRTKNGGFRNVEELKLVQGIGDKLFEKIKNEIGL